MRWSFCSTYNLISSFLEKSTLMSILLKPIYLFADSQLLFWKSKGIYFLETIRRLIENKSPRAVYLGASNGDNPDYYSIFIAAMENTGICNCRMILSSFSSDDSAFLDKADIILLSGGDIERGWNVFTTTGMKEVIIRKYFEGAILIGISAGAIQLGLFGWRENGILSDVLFNTFKLIPFVISAHGEKQEWEELKKVVKTLKGTVNGIGIPAGGGMIYHPDNSIEPIRIPLHEISIKNNNLIQNLIFPGQIAKAQDL
jgi:cyanophycinase